MQKDHEKIRQRAYEIWDREGRQEGRADDHWLQAEREIGVPSGEKNETGVPAQAKKRGNGAAKPAAAKSAAKAAEGGQPKRRGSQPSTQG